MTPMRILYVTDARTMGGAEWSLVDLLRAVNKDDVCAFVAAPPRAQLPSCLDDDDATVFRMPLERLTKTWNPVIWFKYAFSCIRTLKALRTCIRANEVDIIHANSVSAQVYCAVLSLFVRVPLVWQCRDLARFGIVEKWLARRATRVIAVSETVRRHVTGATGTRAPKVVTVLNGIDIDRVGHAVMSKECFRRDLGIPADAFVVGMVGQYVPWKNHDIFLKTASLVSTQVAHSRFVVLGTVHGRKDRRYIAQLREKARDLDVSDKLYLLEYRADVQSFYAGIDVLLHPAGKEPFGRVILEAMLYGKPVVIADDASGPAEIVAHEQDGILVTPGTPEQLTRPVVRLAHDNTERQRLAESARRKVVTQFTADRMARDMVQVYCDLLQCGDSRDGFIR